MHLRGNLQDAQILTTLRRRTLHLNSAVQEVALLQRLADGGLPKHDGPHVLKDAAAAVAVQLSLHNPVPQVLIELPEC